MFAELFDIISDYFRKANLFGIAMPMVRDPKTKSGSVSLTLVFISSLMVIAGLVGKWSGYLGKVDIDNALQFFYASSALYFGRKWTGKQNALSEKVDQKADKLPTGKEEA